MVGVQIGSRHEKLTVESGRSKGAGVAAGLGDALALSVGSGLLLALGKGDGLGGAADCGPLLQAASIRATSRTVTFLTVGETEGQPKGDAFD
jgi:hypothetical protein